ncbi:uncharacterized protein SCHCODRAFT_02695106 [Schizophyllum commune H4-8]|uniref:Uncharacterized protein n=1 Tax=Schizophyllum commune (strain H4-8 / FGSC 9210) TaxID=578458 RepID=D8PWS4_SCHCM|nr:uncharacterized protein SCHCODRAFT_02695106 [Schizophyllum commune H4-8]KAI5899836.1 hypothetical protein SCHCODRAFT_02695106 [Schizophyllum commune H4-8]
MMLAAPCPIALSSDPFLDNTPRSSSSLCFPTQLPSPRPPRVKNAPPRLQSPIRLAEPGLRSAPLPYQQARSSAKKRNTRLPSRRQHMAEPVFKSGLANFDELPWVAALQSECAAYSCHAADIGDLSQLDIDRRGAGPVRRRKTSLRASPIAVPRQLPTPAATPTREDRPAFPFVAGSNPHYRPHTPVKRSPTRATDRVIFRHLMPLLSAPEHDAGPGIIRL